MEKHPEAKTTFWLYLESKLQLKMALSLKGEINWAKPHLKHNEVVQLQKSEAAAEYHLQQPAIVRVNNPTHSNANLCFYVTRSQSRSARAFNPTTAQRSEIWGLKAQLATAQSCLHKASVHHQPAASSSFTYRCFWIEDHYLFVHISFTQRLIRTPPICTGCVTRKHEDRHVY